MQEDLVKNLIEAGLDDSEAEIYLAVLQLGMASVTDIAKKSKIKRTTIYEYLDNLVSKNLLHKTAKGKRILYIAENPNKILKVIERRKKNFEKILPNLENVFNLASHKPQVRFYEGIDGMRKIYDEMSSTSQIIYSAFSADQYRKIFTEKDDKKFFNNIRENGGQIKDLLENTPIGRKHIKGHIYAGVGSPKLLPKDFKLSVDLMVAGDKVAMISLVNLIGIVIENPEIAELQRNFCKFVRRNS